MSTATMRRGEIAAAAFSTRPVADFFQHVMAARQAKADKSVARYLAACPDERLLQLGLSTADIRAVRTGTFQGVRG